MQVVTIFGSNSGNKQSIIEQAIDALADDVGKVTSVSSYYETEPWGFDTEEIFLNKVVVFESELSPEDFLGTCLSVEKKLGRVRSEEIRYTSRTIDIDILFYGSEVINTPALIVPHPRIAERNFVMVPLCEIIPDFIHPQLHQKISALLKDSPDQLEVKKLNG